MMNISLIVNSVKCTVLTRFLQYLRRMYCYYPSILYEVLILYKYKEGSISTALQYSFFTLLRVKKRTFVCAVVALVVYTVYYLMWYLLI